MQRFKSRKSKVLGAVVGFLAAGSLAFAAWSVFPSGNAYTRTGAAPTAIVMTMNASEVTTAVTTPLTPGQTGSVAVKVNNTSAYALILKAVDFSGSYTTLSGSTCDQPANFSTPDLTGLSIPVPVGTSTLVIPAAVTMGANAQTVCASDTIIFGPTVLTLSTS